MPEVDEAEQAAVALAQVDEAFARMDLDHVVAGLSAAIRGFTAAGEPCQAAMACTRLGQVMQNYMGNPTAGRAWFARAERLVADQPPCLEQGWVAVAAMGCDVEDPAVLLERAELALDRARRFGDLDLETKALADGGLARVEAGRVAEGMAMLDEAMALACGPAHEDAASASVCSFFTACYFAMDFDRADTWAETLRRRGLVGERSGSARFLSNHCDSVQATLLLELGRWTEAEALLLQATASFEAAMGPAWHSDIALADLRTRQGRHTDAEALLLGKEHAPQALLPAARLQLARGDHELALAAALRGLRLLGDDRLRAVELLTVAVEAHLAGGDVDAAAAACRDLEVRLQDVNVPALTARRDAACAAVLAARGDPATGTTLLEAAIDGLDRARLPWLRATLLLQLSDLREQAGDATGAGAAARTAALELQALDVSLPGLGQAPLASPAADASVATLHRQDGWWTATSGGTSVRLRDSKGLRYLAELVASPGVERHALDLVDRVEGVGQRGEPDRRALGDAGELLDTAARSAYRRRIEALRGEIDDALETERLETAEALQTELDQLVAQLAQAFGLGGRSRVAASAAERARLNVTRAIRSALARLDDALPGAGAALDRRVRTGLYCTYAPEDSDTIRWIVQPAVNGTRPA